MAKRSLILILPVCVALSVACGSDGGLEPERSPKFNTLEVRPTVANLFTLAPGNRVHLSIEAWDRTGARMTAVGTATYSSSAPAIAEVNSDGIVIAAAPGTAVITATLTLGGITRRASMRATVHGPDTPGDYSDITGVYDLTAMITGSDPAWGIEDGTRQTAVITIQHTRNSPRFDGTFADFRAIDPNGEYLSGNPGFVTGTIDPIGRVVIIELTNQGSQSSYWYGDGMLTSRRIVGRFGAGGHISGTFTAERRQEE